MPIDPQIARRAQQNGRSYDYQASMEQPSQGSDNLGDSGTSLFAGSTKLGNVLGMGRNRAAEPAPMAPPQISNPEQEMTDRNKSALARAIAMKQAGQANQVTAPPSPEQSPQ